MASAAARRTAWRLCSGRSRAGMALDSSARAPAEAGRGSGRQLASGRYEVMAISLTVRARSPVLAPRSSAAVSRGTGAGLTDRQRLGVRVDAAVTVEHRELVGVAGRTRSNQRGDQGGLAGEARARYQQRAVAGRDPRRRARTPSRGHWRPLAPAPGGPAPPGPPRGRPHPTTGSSSTATSKTSSLAWVILNRAPTAREAVSPREV